MLSFSQHTGNALDVKSAQMVKDFIVSIQEEFTLKHVNFLTSENPVEFLGRSIKRLKNGNITPELGDFQLYGTEVWHSQNLL